MHQSFPQKRNGNFPPCLLRPSSSDLGARTKTHSQFPHTGPLSPGHNAPSVPQTKVHSFPCQLQRERGRQQSHTFSILCSVSPVLCKPTKAPDDRRNEEERTGHRNSLSGASARIPAPFQQEQDRQDRNQKQNIQAELPSYERAFESEWHCGQTAYSLENLHYLRFCLEFRFYLLAPQEPSA